MGIRASSTTTVHFDETKVPVENLLGEEGKGFKVAMSILNHGRTGLGAGSVGGQKRLLRAVTEHATNRKQFGRPIGSFGLMKEKIGRISMNCYVTESLTYWVAGLIDRGATDYSLEGAATKVFATETLWYAVDESMQIAGGMGYMKEAPYERAMRDARINRIFEGTNEILRLYVGLTGVQKPGEYLKGLGKELSNALTAPIKSLGLLTEYAARRARLATPLGRGQLTKAHPLLRRQVVRIEHAVQELASTAEAVLRKHGKEIIEKQFATRRLADVAIDLLAMSAVVARTSHLIEKRGAREAANEIDMTNAFCQDAIRRIRANFRAAQRNNDEEIKAVADRAMADGGYQNDVLKD